MGPEDGTRRWDPKVGPYGETQEQPFAAVLQNRCSETFRNIHKKNPVLESLFNKRVSF